MARAMGLGSAKEGVEIWWMERVSAAALVPLTLWFVASIIAHTGSDYDAFIAWLGMPLASILMILLLIVLFYHTALGLQVVIEDYIHSQAKFVALVLVRLGCFALGAAGVFAALGSHWASRKDNGAPTKASNKSSATDRISRNRGR